MAIPQILLTKVTIPQLPRRILFRERVQDQLLQALDYQLTILHAGAGYGKSTALAGFANASLDVAWYRVSEEDTDPLVFLLHLCHATQITLPDIDNLPFSKIHNWNGTQGPLPTQEIVIQYINAIQEQINEPLLIVIDDIHLIHEVQEIAYILDHLIGLAPANLHFVLSSRRLLKLPNLSRWRGQGKVLSLDKHVLAFSSSEIETLFNTHYGYEISEGDAEQLSQLTEGWAITLQLFWQGLRSGALVSINELASRSEETLDSLFALLATEVFDKQPIDIQQFLKETSVLQRMSPDACEAIFDFSDSRAIMAYLRRQELFVMENGADELRYHNIFHQFLQQQLSVETAGELHQKAATYYLDQKIFDLAIYHFMQAKDFASTADLLTEYGRQLQSEGRLDSLATYLDAIPPEILAKYPILLFMLGNLARLHSRFQEALGWYQQAERLWREAGQVENVARALRGQARVYLDTINPSKAESLLQQALRLSDRIEDLEAQARLFELLSENKLNLGKMEEAEALSKKAQLLRLEGPADEQLQFRVLLRTGQLEEARLKLEASAEYEKENPVQTPRGHRETQLLLSIICAFQGDAAAALSTAELGMKRGQDLDSPFIIAVAHMRQGHALALDQRPGAMQRARSEFQKAIDLSQYLSVPRLRVEASWGLSRTYGYQGDLIEAQRYAEAGIDIANRAGDEWIASLIRVTLGASFVLNERFETAQSWLEEAIRGFSECGDPFGIAAAYYWLALAAFKQKEDDAFTIYLSNTLEICHDHHYDFLFTRTTLLGVPDNRLIVPMLLHAHATSHSAYANALLEQMGLGETKLHPGFQLRVNTLGSFDIYRGSELVSPKAWQREKSRQLFQLLITQRHSPLDREQIFDALWPDAEFDVAQRNFKVTFSTMLRVLEPDRKPGSDSAFILRDGSIYALRPHADIWIDAETYLHNIKTGIENENLHEAIQALSNAITLYRGEYLPDVRYENWALAEREHLSVKFLQASDRLCELYLESRQYQAVLDVCQLILNQDNCWERAYRHLMQAYHELGDHGQVARTYQRCIETMQQELDVSPSDQTDQLYQSLID